MKRVRAAICGIFLCGSLAVAAGVKGISSVEAKGLMDKNRNVFLLDVRTTGERNQGYIPGSVLIPIDTLEKRIKEVPKNRPIVVYCAVGSRSSVAADLLVRKGFTEVYNMRDGIVGWYRNQLPIQR